MTYVAVFRCGNGHVQDVPSLAMGLACDYCVRRAKRIGVRPCFDSSLDVVWLDDGRLQLEEALTYYAADGRAFTIPAGFRTDLASVPRILPGLFRLLFRSELHTARAAVLHDFLYASGAVTRREADALFYEALRATHEGTVGAWAMWLGVRAGGWFAWRGHRRAAK